MLRYNLLYVANEGGSANKVQILLFSFMDTCVRVLEANIDGEQFTIRATRLYDFKAEEDPNFSLSIFFDKWWMGQAADLSY